MNDQLMEHVFTVSQEQRRHSLETGLSALCEHHYRHCAPYARIVDSVFGSLCSGAVEDLPFLPVGLFKTHELLSVPRSEITTLLRSSGTTGQEPSRVHLDAETADLQARALSAIFHEVLGASRLPMLILDSDSLFTDRRAFSARGAAVLGMMRFGRNYCWALDGNLNPKSNAIRSFLRDHSKRPFLVFGFTWVVWRHFAPILEAEGFDLSNGVLVHSGGWKRLEAEAVSAADFNARFQAAGGIRRVVNFYGMVEQVGSVFVEGTDGLLHAPRFADIIIRDSQTLRPIADGEVGVIQVVSLLPRSYPGHSLITEDLGVVVSRDEGAWGGKAFRVLGRLPNSELRGCSDVGATKEVEK